MNPRKELPFGWKEKLMALSEEGAGIAEILKEIGISRNRHDAYMKDTPEYSAAFEDARLISEAWWMKQGRDNLNNKNYNNTMWIFNMKNRFYWRDQPIMAKSSNGSAFDDIRERDETLARYTLKEVKTQLKKAEQDNIN